MFCELLVLMTTWHTAPSGMVLSVCCACLLVAVLSSSFCPTRFGIGRFTTEEEIDYTVKKCVEEVERLRSMRRGSNVEESVQYCLICSVFCRLFVYSPLWEMVQEGIDLKTIQWSQH